MEEDNFYPPPSEWLGLGETPFQTAVGALFAGCIKKTPKKKEEERQPTTKKQKNNRRKVAANIHEKSIIEQQDEYEKNTTSAFGALVRVAKAGQNICFSLDLPSGSHERIGIILGIHSGGIVIDTESGIEWIPAKGIKAWRLPKEPGHP
jgi:hypothetical protein